MFEETTFAVCWVPPREEPLAMFGRALTGWCAEAGERVAPHDGSVLGLQGLHGAIVPPFRLAPGIGARRLEQAVAALAGAAGPVALAMLRPALVGRRLALVPVARILALERLLETACRALAPLGAPARPSHPFHLALSDPMPELTGHRVLRALRAQMRRDVGAVPFGPAVVADLALMQVPGPGHPLRLRRRYRLVGADASNGAAPARGPSVLIPLPRPRGAKGGGPPG